MDGVKEGKGGGTVILLHEGDRSPMSTRLTWLSPHKMDASVSSYIYVESFTKEWLPLITKY